MSNIPTPYGGPACAAHRPPAQAVGVDADRCGLVLSSVLGSRIAPWQSPTGRDHPLPEWSTSSGESMRKGVRAERSAIPAKGDRGLSGSAMVRSYSQVPRTTRGRIARHLPLRPGPAGDVQRRLVPRRGWGMLDIGNGGPPHFQEAVGSHFQPICWKWKKSREAAISRFPRPFSRR